MKNTIVIDCKNKTAAQVRRLVLIRDNFICQSCGENRPNFLEVHHKDGNHNNNYADNLITLCIHCHQAEHIKGTMKNGYMPFIKKLLIENDITIINHLVPMLGISQPSISEFIATVPSSYHKLKNLKDTINALLHSNYSIEDLFELVPIE